MSFSFRSILLLIFEFSFLAKTLAFPVGDFFDPYNGTAHDLGDTLRARQNGGKALRVMPLGASITQGVGSNPENGTI